MRLGALRVFLIAVAPIRSVTVRYPTLVLAFPTQIAACLLPRRIHVSFHTFCDWLASRITIASVSLALALALCGCNSNSSDRSVIDLQDKTYPTGIDHWPAKSVVIFGDFGGSIYSIREDGTRVIKLTDIREIDCARVTRVRVDEARNRLWVMSASGICVYDLQSLQLTRYLPIGDMSHYRLANGLTDIALDPQGNAYAIDSGIDPVLYRIESATFAVAMWNKVTPKSVPGVYSPRHFPLNAIVVTPQGGHVLYVNAYSGELHVVDISSKQRSTVSMPQTLYGVNALVAAPSTTSPGGIDLYAVSARNNSITVVGIDSDLKNARARIYATKYLDNPLAGTLVRGSVFVTNSQLLRHPELSGDRDKPRPFSIVRLGSKYFADQAANPVMGAVLGP
jgi:DNA-binding beta-propeller fold protein YncE